MWVDLETIFELLNAFVFAKVLGVPTIRLRGIFFGIIDTITTASGILIWTSAN
jgi:hypothetical protein